VPTWHVNKEDNMEWIIRAFIIIGAFSFLGWCIWVLNPKHPERLEKLRKEWGVRGD
jgi:hypothetical protein